jgi:asparagine N-glycosylation enzyme membrane subunit Stt3
MCKKKQQTTLKLIILPCFIEYFGVFFVGFYIATKLVVLVGFDIIMNDLKRQIKTITMILRDK